MGNFFQVIVDRDATEFEAADLARLVLKWLISEQIVEAASISCPVIVWYHCNAHADADLPTQGLASGCALGMRLNNVDSGCRIAGA